MSLIEDWKKCWKWMSIQANTLGVAISGTYAALYDEVKANFPAKYMLTLTAVVFLAGIVGRLISQTPKDKE